MNKKIYFQASIFLSILLIILYVYFIYFKNDYKILVKTEDNITNNNSIESKDDLITEMKYFSEDDKGNRFEIEADNGVINPDQSNLIRMNKLLSLILILSISSCSSSAFWQSVWAALAAPQAATTQSKEHNRHN